VNARFQIEPQEVQSDCFMNTKRGTGCQFPIDLEYGTFCRFHGAWLGRRELTRLLFLMASVAVGGSNAAKAQLIEQMRASAKWLVENVELVG
jgi:hypothetical protein